MGKEILERQLARDSNREKNEVIEPSRELSTACAE